MPTFVACAAYTKRGDPCKNAAKDASAYCGVHRNMTPEENERLRQIHAADREAYARLETYYQATYPGLSITEARMYSRAGLKAFQRVLEMEHMDPENIVVLLDAVLAPDRATQQRIIQENGIVNASDANLRKLLSAVQARRGWCLHKGPLGCVVNGIVTIFCQSLPWCCAAMGAATAGQ